MDYTIIQSFIKQQSDETIALILTAMEPYDAVSLLESFDPKRIPLIMETFLKMHNLYPDETLIKDTVKVLEFMMNNLKSLLTTKQSKKSIFNFRQGLISILEQCDTKQRKRLMALLKGQLKDNYKQIEREILTVDVLKIIPDHAIQMILRGIERDELIIVLKNHKDLRPLVFKNIDRRSRDLLKEDIDFFRPVLLKRVKHAERYMVSLIRKLATEDVLDIPIDDKDIFL